MSGRLTLTQWLQSQQSAPPALAGVLATAAAACAEVAGELRSASIVGLSGALESTNVQGETQKKLDVVSNDAFIAHCRSNSAIAVAVSEELDEALLLSDADEARYALVFDPLDGSSNLDVNVTVGSIFSVLQARDTSPASLLQPGNKQLAAGYAAYGPSTTLVLTLGEGVAVFALDVQSGEFLLVEDNVLIPAETNEYAINSARQRFWDQATRTYVEGCVQGEEGAFGKRYNMRWIGSMVADIHRIVNRGGIFLYPVDSETVGKGGRLRLLYEANPMSLIIEAAGGAASTGRQRILDVTPSALHQRVPVILGSREEVERITRLYAGS